MSIANPEENQFSYLHEITGGDPEIMAEFVELFLTQLNEMLTQFQAALSTQNLDELQMIAHKMKSSFGVVGLDTTLLSAIESGVKEGKVFNEIEVFVITLLSEIDHIQKLFSEELIKLKQ